MPHPATASPGDGESSLVSPVLPSANAFPEEPTASSSKVLLEPHQERRDRLFSSSSGPSSLSPPSPPSRPPILPPPREHELSSQELQTQAASSDMDQASGAEVDLRVQHQFGRESDAKAPAKQPLAPPKGWLHFVAGGVGGMCGGIITAPLDVVKTRLQSDLFQQRVKASTAATANSSGGVFGQAKKLGMHFVETGQLLKEIATKEGPSALFKGLGPTLVGAVPARSINFATYGNGKLLLAENFNGGKETPAVHLSAAALAGVVTATATNPIWVVKTRMQLESHQAMKSERESREKAIRREPSTNKQSTATSSRQPFSTFARLGMPESTSSSSPGATMAAPALRERSSFFNPARSPPRPGTNSFQMISLIVRNEGIKGLYKGMSASYLGVAEGTIQWVLYEYLKRSRYRAQQQDQSQPSKPSILSGTIGPAGIAKFTAALITYPHEVIRTRLRQQPETSNGRPKYTGLLQTIKLVFREEGFTALYGGLSAHLMRVVPNAAVMFTIYELALRFGSHAQQQQQQQQQGGNTSRSASREVSRQ